MLGEVAVSNNNVYGETSISSIFDNMLTQPVTSSQVEENLYLLNDFPGLAVSGYFEAGHQVGDTKLNINVNTEDKYASNIRLDNHGTTDTGKYRLFADFQINNIMGLTDLLNLSILTATAPSNTNYWKANYKAKLFSPRWFFNFGASTNQFIVDRENSNLNLNGIVSTEEISAIYKLNRSRVSNDTFELKYQSVASDLQLGDIPDLGNALDEKIFTTSLMYKFDFLQEKQKRLHQGNVVYTSGQYDFGEPVDTDKEFKYLTFDYSLLTFMKIPFTDSTSRLIFRTGGQYAGKYLSSISKYSLAGPSRARAYSSNVYSADDALFTSLDLIFNSPDMFDFTIFGETKFKDIAKPFVFVDYSYGIQRAINSLEVDVKGELFDAGIGLKFNYLNKIQGNLHFAFPVRNKFSDPGIVITEESMRVVFDIQYKF